MPRIFISYSRKDEEFARQLATSLTASGADVWIDLEDIPAGMKWSSAIQEGLDTADLMVVIISPDSMGSRNVEDEWQYYLDNGKPVIPVLLRPAKIHFQLARIQYIDFHNQPYGRALNQLYTEFRRKGVPLEGAPNTQDKPPVSHIPPTPSSAQPTMQFHPPVQPNHRNLWLIGGGIAAALVIGLGIGLLSFSNPAPTPTPDFDQLTNDALIEWLTPTARAQLTDTEQAKPTHTFTMTDRPSNTPTVRPSETPQPSNTPSPTLTPTTAARLGIDTQVTHNGDWTAIHLPFGGVDMVLAPAGCFTMGSSDQQISAAYNLCPFDSQTCGNLLADERPQTEICFVQPFWIDRYEVTNQQYGSSGTWADPNHPRTNVTWQEAQQFCESRGGRLPTEAEWEYAARGPDGLIFPWGNSFIPENLNYCDADCEFNWRDSAHRDYNAQVSVIGAHPDGVSWVGAKDMAGNVWEWTSTIYGYAYPYDPDDGRENPGDVSSERTLRGGSWNWIALDARTTARDNPVQPSSDWYGFRCARDFQPGDF